MMASGATPTPQMELPDPLIDGRSGDASPKKPTNSLELGQETLSGGPSKGLRSSLDALLHPRSMATEGWPQKASLRGSGPIIVALRRVWSSG